ncbi:MAG: ATP-binding protein [Deltaproteobacteria bacterium]|nr:ATP-binding protein [Deltaproteobacteria bacterium]
MVETIESCALVGIEPYPVLCEVDLAAQLPSVSLVGLPSSMTQESRDRIRAAVTNSEFEWPARKVTINLLPASLPKWGSHYELAMALGVLRASARGMRIPSSVPDAPANEVATSRHASVFAIGELSLSGQVRPCGWLPSIAAWLHRHALESWTKTGVKMALVAHPNDIRALEGAMPCLRETAECVAADSLSAAMRALRAIEERNPASDSSVLPVRIPGPAVAKKDPLALLKRVEGEPLGVVTALVAAAGGYHALFAGPQGRGKSMLVRATCEASKPATGPEKSARTAVLGLFGENYLTESGDPRPVIRLQSSVTRAALEGTMLSTGQIVPGELTRAHLGVLVADEFLELRRDVIEAFRQPIEEQAVRLSRAKIRAVLPAKFQLLASTNLCACGYFGLTRRDCRCSRTFRQDYRRKLSGPILDRFDLIALIGHDHPPDLPPGLTPMIGALTDPSKWIERLERVWGANPTAENSPPLVAPAGVFPPECSPRAREKLVRVASTLADLLDEPAEKRHLELALCLRQDLDRVFRDAEERENWSYSVLKYSQQ